MADRLRRRGGRRYALGHGRSGRGGRAAVRRAVPRRRIFPVTDRGRPRARRGHRRRDQRSAASRRVSITVFTSAQRRLGCRSEEHTSELQSLMRISYAVFCLKKKIQEYKNKIRNTKTRYRTTRQNKQNQ